MNERMPALIPLLTREECRAIVDAARESGGWRDATVQMGGEGRVVAAVRSARMLRPGDAEPPLAALLDDLRARLDRLEEAVGSGTRIGELQLVCYPAGGFFLPHVDASPDPRERRRTSVIVYLNDDFAGGETEFAGSDAIVRAAAGTALLFAPHRPHAARPVTAGEKWVVVAWLERE